MYGRGTMNPLGIKVCVTFNLVYQFVNCPLYTGKTYTHNFHVITFSYENRMKFMQILCKRVIRVYHAQIIYNFHVKIMRLSCDFRTY